MRTIGEHAQLAILANVRITRDRLRIPCPAHGGTNPNLELKVAGDRISAVCFSQGCSYRDIAQAIEAKFGISIGRGHNEEKTLTRTEHRPALAAGEKNGRTSRHEKAPTLPRCRGTSA